MTLRPAPAHRREWRRILGIFVRALALLALVWFVFQALTGIHAATHAPAEWRAMQ